MRTAVLLAATSLALCLAACRPASPEASGLPEPDTSAAAIAEPAGEQARVAALQVATIDGRAYDLADHRGSWVVVNYWATWCSPCLEEMPELSALASMRDHVEVVGLAYEDIEAEAMRGFLERHPVTYPVAIIDPLDPPADFATPRGLPMTWLIGPDGRVVKELLGPVTAMMLEEAIAAAGGPAPGAPAQAPRGGAGADRRGPGGAGAGVGVP